MQVLMSVVSAHHVVANTPTATSSGTPSNYIQTPKGWMKEQTPLVGPTGITGVSPDST